MALTCLGVDLGRRVPIVVSRSAAATRSSCDAVAWLAESAAAIERTTCSAGAGLRPFSISEIIDGVVPAPFANRRWVTPNDVLSSNSNLPKHAPSRDALSAGSGLRVADMDPNDGTRWEKLANMPYKSTSCAYVDVGAN